MAYDLNTVGSRWYGNLSFWDKDVSPQQHTSLMELVPLPMLLYPAVAYTFMDDFMVFDLTTDPVWSITEDGGETGTPALQQVANGVYRQYTDTDDEDEFYIHNTNETFQLRAGKHLFWEARVKLTEVSGVTANYIVGLSENVGADHLRDAGAGPPINYDGMCWFKTDSNMFIEFETSLATAQVTSVDVAAHVSGTWYRFGAWCKPLNATTFTVYPFYQIGTANGVLRAANTHALTIGGGEMQAFWGAKTGDVGGATEEYIDIDYFWVCQER